MEDDPKKFDDVGDEGPEDESEVFADFAALGFQPEELRDRAQADRFRAWLAKR